MSQQLRILKIILVTSIFNFCSSSAAESQNPTFFNVYFRSFADSITRNINHLSDMIWDFGETIVESRYSYERDHNQSQELTFVHADKNVNKSDTGLFFSNANMQDVLPLVLSGLCYDKNAVENLYVCSQVCTQWYQASKSKELNSIIKMRYCGHLPKEYVDHMEDGQQMTPFQLVRLIFDRQNDEIEQLENIFKGVVPNLLCWQDPIEAVLKANVEDDFLRKLFARLKFVHSFSLVGSSLFDDRENILEAINTELLKSCLEIVEVRQGSIGTVEGWKPYKHLDICLHGAVTRLTLEGISALKEKIFWAENDVEIHLGLTANKLRWIPDELFPLPRIEKLDLRNNLLKYIPSTILWNGDHLKSLYIGNYQGSGITCSCCDSIGLRTTGNSFKIVPPIILKLKNLESLDLSNIGLENFNELEVYKDLPLLEVVNLNHNNLIAVPSLLFCGREMCIRSVDNPICGYMTTNMDEWIYRFNYLKAMTLKPILRHPIRTMTMGVGIWLYLNWHKIKIENLIN